MSNVASSYNCSLDGASPELPFLLVKISRKMLIKGLETEKEVLAERTTTNWRIFRNSI
jgi:hypothetical protein